MILRASDFTGLLTSSASAVSGDCASAAWGAVVTEGLEDAASSRSTPLCSAFAGTLSGALKVQTLVESALVVGVRFAIVRLYAAKDAAATAPTPSTAAAANAFVFRFFLFLSFFMMSSFLVFGIVCSGVQP